MFWIDGRFSWPLIIMAAYSTIVIAATDTAWRLIQAPIAVIAGGGLAAILIGNALIALLGARGARRSSG